MCKVPHPLNPSPPLPIQSNIIYKSTELRRRCRVKVKSGVKLKLYGQAAREKGPSRKHSFLSMCLTVFFGRSQRAMPVL